ncbi:MAG: hypothetical protein SV686_11920 [Thermodesulfobacteriota bacterium]|nr:hypothetical protein [Thermodesulfobacteriota bacterium]
MEKALADATPEACRGNGSCRAGRGLTVTGERPNHLKERTSSYPRSSIGRFSAWIPILVIAIPMNLIVCMDTQAYIMPIEQLAGLMGENFSGNDTFIVTQTSRLINAEDGSEALVWEEKISAKSPHFIRSAITGRPGTDKLSPDGVGVDPPVIDASFYRLFMANDKTRLIALLSEMGINTEVVSFTRLEGIIGYRVGNKYGNDPILIIEKERFLPLFLRYRYLRDSEWKTVSVKFDDYRTRLKRWFPGKINLFLGEEFDVKSVVTGVQVNIPLEDSLFEGGEEPGMDGDSRHEQGVLKDRPLQEMIKTLREKYGTDQ